MYENGQALRYDDELSDHIGQDIPIQIYKSGNHRDIGFVQEVLPDYVRVNDTYYRRDLFEFISRPGY